MSGDDIVNSAIREAQTSSDAPFRAIGRYVVTFSELVSLMRDIACEYVAKGDTDMLVPSMLLGEATAQTIANAYFGLCRTMGELEDDEERVWTALRNSVQAAIEMRNWIAHGDWSIADIGFVEGEPSVAAPRLIRIRPARLEGPREVRDLTVTDIDGLSNHLEELLPLVQEFGKLALKLPVTVLSRRSMSVGEFRVRDVLTVTGSRKAGFAIAWNGPHKGDVLAGVYTVGRSGRSPYSPDQ